MSKATDTLPKNYLICEYAKKTCSTLTELFLYFQQEYATPLLYQDISGLFTVASRLKQIM